MSQPAPSGPTPEPQPEPAIAKEAARRGINHRPVNWLLFIPLIGVLVPEFYNFNHPQIGGMPFFYWYQLVWIPVSVLLTWAVYRSTKGQR